MRQTRRVHVSGTDAPVYYGALQNPDGTFSGAKSLNFFSEDAAEFKSVKEIVKDKTGCDVVSFQKAVVKPVTK
jgi:hypothetical protein